MSENFKDMCLEIYELDPAKFLPAPGLAWQAALKKTKVKLHLLTDTDGQYLQKLHELQNNLPVFLERVTIKKIEKLVANLHDKLNVLHT